MEILGRRSGCVDGVIGIVGVVVGVGGEDRGKDVVCGEKPGRMEGRRGVRVRKVLWRGGWFSLGIEG